MSRPHLTVIVPGELADGYRLAGVDTETADSTAAAGQVLGRLTARAGPDAHRDPGPDTGHGARQGTGRASVVAVHPPYLAELGARRQRRIAERDDVLVIALPQGGAPGEPAPAGDSLHDLLARAVGYEFTFDPAGSGR